MDDFSDSLSRVALCVSSCMAAKEGVVAEFGIGEDLPFTLFGWCGDRLVVVVQLHKFLMGLSHEDRLGRVVVAGLLLRRAWHCDGFTFVAEGFCSSDGERSRGVLLEELFVDASSGVDECLTFAHVDGGGVGLVVVPYRQVVGRRVVWGDVMRQGSVGALRDSSYVDGLVSCLGEEVGVLPEDLDTFFSVLAVGLWDVGFSVQVF